MDKKNLKQTILQQWQSLGLDVNQNLQSDLNLNLTFWEDVKQKKPILFQNSVFLDETTHTIFYWEKSKDKAKGFFGDGDVDVTTQSGQSLFRQVKHFKTDDSGNQQIIDLNLGDISKSVKSLAKDNDWKFKVVLSQSKAMYPVGYTSEPYSQNESVIPTQASIDNSNYPPISKPVKINPKRKIGITFSIFWLVLTVLAIVSSIGMNANWITYPIVIGILALALVLRRYLFKGFIKGTLLLFSTILVIFILLMFSAGDQSLNQDTKAIQEAFEAQDIQVIETYIHPETKAELMPIFIEHQAELTRISELMKTKTLIYADDNYAEYEVTDNNQSFTMVFEKVGDIWLLVRF